MRPVERETRVRATPLAIANVASDRLQRLHRLWNERRGAKRWPAFADLPPGDLNFMQGTATYVEVQRNPLRFRISIIGPAIDELRGRGDQGKMVDDIEPDYYARLLIQHYTAAIARGEPMFHLIQFIQGARPSRYPLAYERVILPLSEDGTAVSMLIAGSDWSEAITPDLRRFHETE